ncbi:hypothetical protein DsansV1_C10g0099811 [Dioscorea sansibarensis]
MTLSPLFAVFFVDSSSHFFSSKSQIRDALPRSISYELTKINLYKDRMVATAKRGELGTRSVSPHPSSRPVSSPNVTFYNVFESEK